MDRLVKAAGLLCGIAVLCVHHLMVGLYGGTAFGVASVSDYRYVYPGIGSWMSHSDPYWILTSSMVPLTWALMFFVILKVFETGWIWRSVALIPAAMAAMFWINVEMVRRDYLSDPQKYVDVLRDSSSYSWAVFGFIAAAVTLQIVSVVVGFRSRAKEKPEELP